MPNGKVERALELLSERLTVLESMNCPDVLLLGDLNLDVLKPNANVANYNHFINSHMSTQIVRQPTRITNTSKTLIDHILTNNTDFYCGSGTFNPGLSDHLMVYTARKRPKYKYSSDYFTGRSYRNFDEGSFYEDIASIDWLILYQIDDVDAAADMLTNLLLNVIDRHAPFKKIRCRNNQPKWVTGDFLSAIDEKEHFCNVFSRRPTQFNEARMRRAIRIVKQMKRALKRGYIEEALLACKGDPKKTWRVIKSLWPGKTKSADIKKINDLTNTAEIADCLNDHFAVAGVKVNRSVTPDRPIERLEVNQEGRPQLAYVNEGDIWKQLTQLSVAKACGNDGIPARVIKACGDILVRPLYHVFNLCIELGKFPKIWKEAKVTPLYKSGSHTDPDNYRPISVLPIFSKLLERLIHNQMSNCLTESGALCEQQSGFRKGHSTTTCLVEFLDHVYTNMDNGNICGVLFLDLRKAFDSVDHEILLIKLEDIGLGDSYVKLIDNYLSDRVQVTKVAHSMSTKASLTCGVPQGSILGPLLFIIYTIVGWQTPKKRPRKG